MEQERLVDLEIGARPPDTPVAQGGEGSVYPLDESGHVLKLYHQPDQMDFTRIRRLIALRENLPTAIQSLLDQLTAWPLSVVTIAGTPSGIAMNAVPGPFYMEVSSSQTPPRRFPRELQYLIVDDFLADRSFYDPNAAERLDLIGAFAYGLAVLHGLGVVVGDISMKNLLWTLSPTPAIFMLDVDSFNVAESGDRPALAETPDWVSPDGLDAPSTQSDCYKLALAAQRIFQEQHSAPLAPEQIAIPGEPELEATVRSLIDRAARLEPGTAREWAVVCGQEDPMRTVPRSPGDWIDAALLAGDWERAVRLANALALDWPRLEIAYSHLAAHAGAGLR